MENEKRMNDQEQKLTREITQELNYLHKTKMGILTEEHHETVRRLTEDRRSQDLLTESDFQLKKQQEKEAMDFRLRQILSTTATDFEAKVHDMKNQFQQNVKVKLAENEKLLLSAQAEHENVVKTLKNDQALLLKKVEQHGEEKTAALENTNRKLHNQLTTAENEKQKSAVHCLDLEIRLEKILRKLDDARFEHVSCGDLLEDKEQKYRELEAEMEKERRMIKKADDKVRVLEQDNMYLRSQVQELRETNRSNTGSSTIDRQNSPKVQN